MLRALQLLAKATVFKVGEHPEWGGQVTVEARPRCNDAGEIGWAVYWLRSVWDQSPDFQGFVHEPPPSSRDDTFLTATRFRFEVAMQIAEDIVAGKLNGTEHANGNRHYRRPETEQEPQG